jgi:hypothetical protein
MVAMKLTSLALVALRAFSVVAQGADTLKAWLSYY